MTDRRRKHEARMREKGFKNIRVWVHEDDLKIAKAFIEKLRKSHEEEEDD